VSRIVDNYLKRLGYLISASQRNELTKENSLVLGGLWAIEIEENRVYIAPYIKEITMSKVFKEQCRKFQIPKKIRAYLFKEGIEPKALLLSV